MNHPVFRSDTTAVEEALTLLRTAGILISEPISEIVFDAQEIRRVIKGRRMRDRHFGAGLFEDPAWDILLDLFAAELEGRRVSISSACNASAVAPTTGLRWISRLADAGVIERHPDEFDRRRSFVTLSESTSLAMRRYVAAMRKAGIAVS